MELGGDTKAVLLAAGLIFLLALVLEPVASVRGRGGPAHQVNLKLAPDDFHSLAELAHQHGVRPTTMARIIVIRELRLGD